MADHPTANVVRLDRVEAPVTIRAYFMYATAAFGGGLFGFENGYMNSIMGMSTFIEDMTNERYTGISGTMEIHVTMIYTLGAIAGALIGGEMADVIGRKITIILGCFIFAAAVVMQQMATGINIFLVGHFLSSLGLGGATATLIIYLSEIAPRKSRGAIVGAFQFVSNLGIFLVSILDYIDRNRNDELSYKIPTGVRILWAIVLGSGMFFLPESPRFHVRKGDLLMAAQCLSRIRGGQNPNSNTIRHEVNELAASYEHERSVTAQNGYRASWLECFSGSLDNGSSKLRRTILGTTLTMVSQWSGVNFMLSFGTSLIGFDEDAFTVSILMTLANLILTPFSILAIDKYGRRPLFIWGGYCLCFYQTITAVIGFVSQYDARLAAMAGQIGMIVLFFAVTWGPGSWVLIGEIFPLHIRAKGIALSIASNFLWNFIVGLITPVLVDQDQGNLGAKIFFIWASLSGLAGYYSYIFIPETRVLTLEQVDTMLAETTPRTSSNWRPRFVHSIELEEGVTRASAQTGTGTEAVSRR